MTHEEFRRFGTALDERVRSQVDTSERLDLLIRARRRGRIAAIAFAMIAVVAVFVATFLIREATGDPPVITAPPTTVIPEQSGLTPLPVEVFLVLSDHYAADPATGVCTGIGPLAGIDEGAQLQMRDESTPAAPVSVVLSAGQEITAQDERASFLLGDELLGCVFVVPDPGFSIAQYENVSISSDADSAVASSMSISGQRVVLSFGEDPQYVEGGSPGVAPEDPADLLAELDELRASARPGFLVGFVNVDPSQSTGSPPSSAQPFCVGVGQFGTIRPGERILITSPDGFVVGETILHGAAFDAHLGCIYWFGIEVPADLGEYRVGVAGMGPVAFGSSVLDEHSWLVNLWTEPIHMQANCLDLEPESEPMTCVLLEPVQ